MPSRSRSSTIITLPLSRDEKQWSPTSSWERPTREIRRPIVKMLVYLIATSCIFGFLVLPSLQKGASKYIPKVYSHGGNADHLAATTAFSSKKYAYATFLSSINARNETRPWISDQEYNEDQFFAHARLLNFQLKHLPLTRSKQGYPLLVLCSPSVEKWKKDKLRAEGAQIIDVDTIPFDSWMGMPAEPRWSEVFTKLLVFRMEEYERILFLDLDMILTDNLDGVFEASEAVQLPTDLSKMKSDEATPPLDYLVVGGVDVGKGHRWPDATIGFSKFFNAGFFLIKPSKALFDHYMSIFKIPNRFDPHYPEQGLMNYAHREDGPMPCQYFEPGKFYANWPNKGDLQHGVNALHFKYTTRARHDKEVVEVTNQRLGEMYGFYLARKLFSPASFS